MEACECLKACKFYLRTERTREFIPASQNESVRDRNINFVTQKTQLSEFKERFAFPQKRLHTSSALNLIKINKERKTT